MNTANLPFITDCLRKYAEALRSGELDGAGHYLPEDIDSAGDMLDEIASAQPPAFERTNRGFPIARFNDRYDALCSLQASSLAFENAIWFGCDDPNPQIMLPDQGWTPVDLPDGVTCSTRMHLTQDMVRSLLPALIQFAATGKLPLGENRADG